MKRIGIRLLTAAVLIACGIFLGMVWTGHTDLRLIGPAGDSQTKIACIGNSTTYGYGISGWPTKNYPYVLSELLGSEYHVANFGLSSHCVQDSADKPYRNTDVFTRSIAYDADIIILMMGANDAKPENWQGIDAFTQAYLALLDAYLQNGEQSQVWLCTPVFPHPLSDGTVSFGIRPDAMEEICTMIRELAAGAGYPLLDMYALTADHPEWFLDDGVHPNAAGAAAMAQYIAENIKS